MPNPTLPDPLPIQPTGSGVADLEVAFEQMKVAQAGDDDAAPTTRGVDGSAGAAEIESEAHPS